VIYLVEDEAAVRELILYTLNGAGLPATGFGDGKEFWQALRERGSKDKNGEKDGETEPALVILDIMLPGDDGIAILKRLRSSKKFTALPVIMLTAKGSEYDKVLGLDSGADDYLVKPVGMMELVARTKALLRRTNKDGDMGRKESDQFVRGALRVDIPAHKVTVGGGSGEREVSLTLKEFDLLVFLLRHEDIVFSRERLLNQVWGFSYAGETRTVDTHIRTLRGKLGSAGALVKTVRGIGYKIGETGEST
jgi:two-component system alkaline phosphatase synthesis response regulator PhoP